MAGANAGAVVAMEVFVKQNEVAPVRVGLKLLGAAIQRALAVRSTMKNSEDPTGYLRRDLQQR